MIDSRKEKVLSFKQAAELLPRRRRGKTPSPSTLYRWATTGLHGIRLETLCVGGSRCTSAEALQRFFERLTAASNTPSFIDRISESSSDTCDEWGDDGR